MFFEKQPWLRWVISTLVVVLCWTGVTWASSVITSIDFNGMVDPPEIKVQGDSPFESEVIKGSTDKEFGILLKGARLSEGASAALDTSSLGTLVSLIRPAASAPVTSAPVTSAKDAAGPIVLVQLNEAGVPNFMQKGNTLLVRVSKASKSSPIQANSTSEPVSDSLVSVPAKSDRLAELMTSQAENKFSGKLITLKLRDANVADVFQLIGEASGFNVVLGKDISGKISLSLEDVPWDQALDVVLHTMELGAERSNNVLRITTLANLTARKQQELAANQVVKQATPKITRIFPISYANLKDLVASLQKFSSSAGSGGSMGSGSFGGGTVQGAGAMAQGGDDPVVIQPDERTNSIIIHDIPKNLDQMKKLIDVLDTQTPQVMIEAKVIEASENFGKSLSGSLGIGDTATGALGSFAGGNPTDQLIGTPGVFASGSAISTLSGTNGTLAFSPNLSFLSSTLRLNAILGIGESENQVKVMASPKTVVLNRQKSSIISTTPVAIPTLAMTPGVGSTPSITISDANLGLTVTPTVTNDSSVLMDLDVSKDVPMTVTGGQGIGKRNIKTQVIVESGTTLVIGGIYTQTSDHGASGFPILRNIPVIGWLFGNELNKEERDEILIFVTPRILNAKDIFSSGGVT